MISLMKESRPKMPSVPIVSPVTEIRRTCSTSTSAPRSPSRWQLTDSVSILGLLNGYFGLGGGREANVAMAIATVIAHAVRTPALKPTAAISIPPSGALTTRGTRTSTD